MTSLLANTNVAVANKSQSDQSDQSNEEREASCNRGERMAGSSGR